MGGGTKGGSNMGWINSALLEGVEGFEIKPKKKETKTEKEKRKKETQEKNEKLQQERMETETQEDWIYF